MSKIDAIRLKNLRCFEDTGFLDLKPITILVGRNSAGKSTFARMFPLLRQSAEEDKRSPILWFGKLVDFGSFSTAIKKGTENKEISISFRFQTVISLRTQPEPDLFDERSKQKLRKKYSREGDTSVELELVLKQNERTGVTYAALIEVTIFENKCRLECDENGGVSKLLINEQDLTPTDSFGCSLNQRNILPSLQYFQTRKLKFEGVERTLRMRISPFLAGIRSRIEEGVHGKQMRILFKV